MQTISMTEVIKEAGITSKNSLRTFISKYRKKVKELDGGTIVTISDSELAVVNKLLAEGDHLEFKWFFHDHKFPEGTELEITLNPDKVNAYEGCFNRCYGVSKFVIKGEGSISTSMFTFSRDIKEVDMSQANIKKVLSGAFSFTDIAEIILPEGVEIIDKEAFYASSVELIHLPKTITSPMQIIETGTDSWFKCFNLKRLEVSKNFGLTDSQLKSYLGLSRILKDPRYNGPLEIVRY